MLLSNITTEDGTVKDKIEHLKIEQHYTTVVGTVKDKIEKELKKKSNDLKIKINL